MYIREISRPTILNINLDSSENFTNIRQQDCPAKFSCHFVRLSLTFCRVWQLTRYLLQIMTFWQGYDYQTLDKELLGGDLGQMHFLRKFRDFFISWKTWYIDWSDHQWQCCHKILKKLNYEKIRFSPRGNRCTHGERCRGREPDEYNTSS